jgi:type II restriction enzyme
MRRLTANNIATFIDQLSKINSYSYIHSKTKGTIAIVSVTKPEGPIRIKRWNSSTGGSFRDAKAESISVEMIWRIANAFVEGKPINFERILGASYNTRSVLEALICATPEFYYCYPGRLETLGGKSKVKKGHKHVIWLPDTPHQPGLPFKYETTTVISEVPSQAAYYDSEAIPSDDNPGIDIEIKRKHAQIQIALYCIGKQLNYRTWIAQNDKGILYNNKRIAEYEGVIPRLQDEKLLGSFQEAAELALMIDCIWFKNGSLMPAVIEVEHSTGVKSGLTRMKNFKDHFIDMNIRYVIVASDEDRNKVFKEASMPQFKDLNTRYFSYSAVEELYILCQKRNIRGVTEEFLDCYMERVLG